MKKNIFDVVSQGMSEYFDEEAELKAEAEARIKAEIEAAWNQHDSNIKEEIKKDFDSALQEQADIVRANKEINEHLENMRSFDEELMHIKYMFRDRTYGGKRRRAAAKAKRNSVKVAIIACCAYEKSAEHDNHFGSGYKLRSLSKSIRGNHGVIKSRTQKADFLIKRAKKVTEGEFDDSKLYY